MTTVAKELIDICEAVEPASKFGEKNKYTKDGVIMSFELGSDESILNLKFEGEGDTRVALDKTFTDQKVSVADMQRIISEHGLAICESSDYCFEVELSDEDFDNGFTALSKKFDVEEDDDSLYVYADSSAQIEEVLKGIGIESFEVEGCEEDTNESISEAMIEGVELKNASSKDRAKGESYCVVSTTEKKYISQGKALAQGITRESAKELAATNPDWDYLSSAFAQDKGYDGALQV